MLLTACWAAGLGGGGAGDRYDLPLPGAGRHLEGRLDNGVFNLQLLPADSSCFQPIFAEIGGGGVSDTQQRNHAQLRTPAALEGK